MSRSICWFAPSGAGRLTRLCALVVVALSVSLSANAFAQQAIVSMPSADITEKGRLFIMHEGQLRPFGGGEYWNTTHFLTYGIGLHTELALTLFDLGLGLDAPPTMAAGFKTAIPLRFGADLRLEPKLTVGAHALMRTMTAEAGHWVYGHVSMRLPWLRARVTAGLGHGSTVLFKVNATHAMVALEQPVWRDKLSVVAEWLSGQHDLGNFIYGLAFHPDHTWIFVLAHKVPTSGDPYSRDKMAIVGEVGVFFF